MLPAPRPDFYTTALPEPPDVRLLVEVADSFLAYDRRTKLPLYARAGISEVWLVDVEAGRVDVHRAPRAGVYSDTRSPGRDEPFAPLAFSDLAVTPTDLLGP